MKKSAWDNKVQPFGLEGEPVKHDEGIITRKVTPVREDEMKENNHKESILPKWARQRLSSLRTTIYELESYRKMHAVLSDKERDWFTLPDPFNGCNDDELNLWILTKNHPFSICALYKGDLLFIGRAHKQRYGERLVSPSSVQQGKQETK